MKPFVSRRSVLAPLMAVAANILMVYVVYSIARVEYLLVNQTAFASSIAEHRLPELFWGGLVFDTPGIFYTNSLYILLMLFPFHRKEEARWQRICKWVFIVINSIALIVNLMDSVYFSYTLRRTSASIFREFGNESNLWQVIGLETLRHWYLVVLAAALIWGMWRLYVMPAVDMRRHRKLTYYIIAVASFVVATVTAVSAIRGGLLNHWYNYFIFMVFGYVAWWILRYARRSMGIRLVGIACGVVAVAALVTAPIGGWRHRDIRPIAISSANAYAKHPVETALVLNTPFTMIRSIGNAAFVDPHYFDDKQQLDAIYSPVHKVGNNPSALGKGKNLCIIIIESFGREYIGGMNHEILGDDYKGYTPFTDSLLNQSVWWKYSYDNGQKSIDAMPSILASIPKFMRPFVVTPQSVNRVKGIPALLGEMGYESAFFHGARTGSMGFNGFARSVGFQKYYGREDFDKDSRFEGEKDFDGYWAIWDEPFLKWYALKMTEMKEPFVTALFTASNHHPFRIPEKYEGKFPEGTMPIHKTAGYTDHALREFFALAKTQPWFQNTVFVITNDHTNMRDHDEYRSDIGSFYGPIIIYDPSGTLSPGMRTGIAQQTDIMPTMLAYLGYEGSYVAYGCDLFSVPAEDAWAVNNFNNTYQYVKDGYVLQFDGNKTIGIYSIDDHLMKESLIGTTGRELQMEQELKAIIQSYMDRMLGDKLAL